MKKLNFETITAGLSTLQDALDQNAVIGWDELVEAEVIDFAEKNSYAADDTDEMIRELADQIEVAGLLTPLGVIKEGNRYRLFSGERRYRAITTYLHWKKIPCRIFQGVSPNKAQLMLHMANGARDYTPARKLELYEEYNDLLRRMKENGEFSGPIQQGVAEYSRQAVLLTQNHIDTEEQLQEYLAGLDKQVHSINKEKWYLKREVEEIPSESQQDLKNRIQALEQEAKPLIREKFLCRDILKRCSMVQDQVDREKEEAVRQANHPQQYQEERGREF